MDEQSLQDFLEQEMSAVRQHVIDKAKEAFEEIKKEKGLKGCYLCIDDPKLPLGFVYDLGDFRELYKVTLEKNSGVVYCKNPNVLNELGKVHQAAKQMDI